MLVPDTQYMLAPRYTCLGGEAFWKFNDATIKHRPVQLAVVLANIFERYPVLRLARKEELHKPDQMFIEVSSPKT